MRVKNSIPIFGNGIGSGKFHSRLSGRELEADIPGNSWDREFPLMVGGGVKLGQTSEHEIKQINNIFNLLRKNLDIPNLCRYFTGI